MNPFPALLALGVGVAAAGIIIAYERKKKAPKASTTVPPQTPDYTPPSLPFGPVEIPGLRGRSPSPSVWSDPITSVALITNERPAGSHGFIPIAE